MHNYTCTIVSRKSSYRLLIACIGSNFTQMSTHPGASILLCTCWVWEGRPQVLCISEVTNFMLCFTAGYYKVLCVDGCNTLSAPRTTPCSGWPWRCPSECYVQSEFDFDSSVVCYSLSDSMLWGHRVAVNIHGCSFTVKRRNTWKRTHPSRLQTCKVLRSWAFFHETMVHVFIQSTSIFNDNSFCSIHKESPQETVLQVILSHVHQPELFYIHLLNWSKGASDVTLWSLQINLFLGGACLQSPPRLRCFLWGHFINYPQHWQILLLITHTSWHHSSSVLTKLMTHWIRVPHTGKVWCNSSV